MVENCNISLFRTSEFTFVGVNEICQQRKSFQARICTESCNRAKILSTCEDLMQVRHFELKHSEIILSVRKKETKLYCNKNLQSS